MYCQERGRVEKLKKGKLPSVFFSCGEVIIRDVFCIWEFSFLSLLISVFDLIMFVKIVWSYLVRTVSISTSLFCFFLSIFLHRMLLTMCLGHTICAFCFV